MRLEEHGIHILVSTETKGKLGRTNQEHTAAIQVRDDDGLVVSNEGSDKMDFENE